MSFRLFPGKPTITDLLRSPNVDLLGNEYFDRYPELYNSPSYDGSANNLENPLWGSAHTKLLRKSTAAYDDGIGSFPVRGTSNPSPRVVSNNICAVTTPVESIDGLTNMCWVWGQFLDHELDLTDTNSSDASNMTTPLSDDYPSYTILFDRSKFCDGVSTPRQQKNEISAFLDATNVYGSSNERISKLRKYDGSGKLKTVTADNGELLPIYNVDGLANAMPGGSTASDFFLVGDVRGNENIALTGMHTIFLREHNLLCDEIVAKYPKLSGKDEVIFQYARIKVIAKMQCITYNEFLPLLIGENTLTTYTGYKKTVDPSIATEFSTVGYRLGHSMLSSELKVGTPGNYGTSVTLKNAFFNPSWVQANGIDQLISGQVYTKMNEINNEIVDDVRNFLFGSPASGMMLDLASLNIQRGRDHGITDYNSLRAAYGLAKHTAFSGITSNSTLQTKLSNTYDTIDDIDPWVGALCEDHVSGAAVGPLIQAILKDQFQRIRDGDRFWWDNDLRLEPAEISSLKKTTLSDVIVRNTVHTSLRSNVFKL